MGKGFLLNFVLHWSILLFLEASCVWDISPLNKYASHKICFVLCLFLFNYLFLISSFLDFLIDGSNFSGKQFRLSTRFTN